MNGRVDMLDRLHAMAVKVVLGGSPAHAWLRAYVPMLHRCADAVQESPQVREPELQLLPGREQGRLMLSVA